MSTKITPTGHYFLPYSEFRDKDNDSLACYYTRVYRKDNPSEYPISVVLNSDSFTIYWHGTQKRDQSGSFLDYSVSKIFSFTFARALQESYEQWITETDLLRRIPSGSLGHYDILLVDENLTFSNTFVYPKFTDSPEPVIKAGEEKFKISLQEFFLDLLFDLYHSNVFQSHPKYFDLVDFINSVPISKAILLKAKFYWARAEYIRLNNIHKNDESKLQKEQVEFNQERLENYRSAWLKFIRSASGESTIELNPWFLGIEYEHELSYDETDIVNTKATLKKEAEDSMQWMIKRYNLLESFGFQFKKIYDKWNRSIMLFGSVGLILGIAILFQIRDVTAIKNFIFGTNVIFTILIFLSFLFIVFLVSILFIERISFYGIGRAIYNVIHRKNVDKQWDANNHWSDSLASIPKLIAVIKPKILLASGVVWTFLFASDVDALWDLSFYFSREKKIIVFFVLFFAFIFVISRLSLYISKNRVERKKPPIGTPFQPKKHRHYFLIFTLSILLIWLIFCSIIPVWSSVSILWSAAKTVLALALLLILLFVLDSKNREKWFVKLTSRAVFVMALATLYSFAIGLVGMSVNAKKEMMKPEQIEVYTNLYKDKEDKLGFRDAFNAYYLKKQLIKDTEFLDTVSAYLPDSLRKKSLSFDDIHLIYSKDPQFKEAFIEQVNKHIANKDHHETILEEVYEKILPKLRHNNTNELVCFRLALPYAKEISQDKAALFALIHPLIFFTFISVAIGLLLEMGLRIEDTGIDFG